ncbi:glycosyltransferase family 4 protein [Candidatus Daviesbacteria bacterium]|nr:glycosyltransferase family 4 protein [Candidatus Daviesbacteria bacterium]
MKIAILNMYQGRVERGAETFVYELSKRLNNIHQVDVITSKSTPKSRWPLLWRFYIDPNGLSVLFFTIKTLPQVCRKKYDVVIPVNGGWQPAFVRLVTWLYRGKMIISGQSGKGWDDRNNLWCFPDTFVAISKDAEDWAKKVNPFVKSVYIPNGVDLNKFKPRGEKYEHNLKNPVVLTVGAFVPSKRMDLVIKAVVRLGDVSLVVVGDGDLKSQIKLMGEELLGDRFILMTASFEEMPKLYRAADLFAFVPEKSEAFGIVYVEAMASGLAVVGTGDDIRAEIIREAGILVENPTDIESLSKAIREGLNTKWGNKPRKQAEKFSWDNIVKKYESLFKKYE